MEFAWHSWQGAPMEFYLTYEGPLKPRASAADKHAIRKALHPQLRELWRRTPFLNGQSSGPVVLTDDGPTLDPHTIESLSNRFNQYGFRWVPLVTDSMSLLCEIDILFLRHGRPGTLITGGDIDNRLKSVFDALQKPQQLSELGGATPTPEEAPFFCLLQDDKLITKVGTTTAPLLEPLTAERGPEHAHLVMKIVVRPYELHIANMGFG